MKKTHMTDEEIMKWYMKGFRDCGMNTSFQPILNSNIPEGISQVAYSEGWIDYIIGDDIPTHDLRTQKQILEEIHNTYNKQYEENPS